jgi:translation initiation factor IF-2
MPIKLNRVIKDLKVGLSTVVDFLHRKGYNIESNPNVKISDEQYNLLLKEFGNGITTKGYLPEKTNRPPETIKKESVHKQDEPEEIITKIPESKIPHFVTKGKIDLDALSPKKYAEDTQHLKSVEKDVPDKLDESNQDEPENDISVIESEKVELIIEPPVTEVENDDIEIEKVGNDDNFVPSDKDLYVEDDGNHEDDFEKEDSSYEKEEDDDEEEEDNTDSADNDDYEEEEEPEDDNDQRFIEEGDDKEEIFRLHETKIKSNIKVTGKIDLSAINQATSPRRKTKEEKQKEREERHNKQMEERKNAQAATAAKPKEHGSFSKPKEQQGGYTKPKEQSGYTKPKEQGGYTKSKDYGTQGKPKEFGGPGKLKERGAPGSSKDQSLSDDRANKKRKRIKKERVDVSNTPGTNVRRDDNRNKQPRVKRPVRVEVSEEDVQKQVKETLARLTTKNSKGKGAKYRREKRDLAASREKEIQEEEMRTSKVLQLTEFVTANDLASMMNVPVTQVISTCMSIGMMVSINQRLDAETINIVAEEFGFTTEYVSADVVEAIAEEEDREEDLVSRPPIITVMGHVDHGKTSLLDNIRKTNVIAGEAGGITQHIGAYNVKLPSGRRITFLDTPGHEAFTAMRARGAQVTDIAIIIVAADDNVMPQTVEAINHASAAVVPIVFAINKIDKPHANPEKIKEELAGMNYLVEDWGGKYQSQEISAKQGIGVPELLEKVLLEADMLNLKANPDKNAVGSIIESSLDKGRGYISTILVSNGTLRQGDVVLAGKHYGRIKAMFNERNQRIDEAGPSAPVLILGLDGAPQAGDAFNVLDTEQEAREIATRRQQLQRELGIRTQKRFGLEELGRRRALGDFHELNLIVKGDVDGSVEALSDSLIRLSTEEIQVNVIHKAVGQISESDISLAQTADAIIIGFQVRPSSAARRMADNEGVEIRLYSIIYNAINEVRDAMEGLLSPEIREDITSEVEVLQVFKITKVGTIAGCMVKEGKIKRTQKVRVIRDGIVVHSGELASLKRFKDEVKEVYTGQECGIHVSNYNDMQIGDIIESYDQTEIKKTL